MEKYGCLLRFTCSRFGSRPTGPFLPFSIFDLPFTCPFNPNIQDNSPLFLPFPLTPTDASCWEKERTIARVK